MSVVATYGGDFSKELDWIRFKIGDTDMDDPLLSDTEIASLLTKAIKVDKAILLCMEAILSKLARECDYRIGPESVSASKRYEQYMNFYYLVKKDLSYKTTVPSGPQEGKSSFTIGMMDNDHNERGVT